MGRQERAGILEELDKRLDGASSVIVADYRGITAEKTVLLRKKFKEASVKYFVVKNTLAGIAAEKKSMGDLKEYFSGPIALAVSKEDPVAPSRVIKAFLKEHPDIIKVKAGYVEGSVLNLEQVTALADIPSREVLLGKMLGSLQSPVVGLVGVMSGPIRSLVAVLGAIKDKKEK